MSKYKRIVLPAFLAVFLFIGFIELEYYFNKYYIEELTDIEISSSHISKPADTDPDSDFSSLPFNLNDTDKLEHLRGKISTLPELWGYSEERGNSLFPPFTYPNCSDVNAEPEGSIDLDVENGWFSMYCANMTEAIYVLGPDKDMLFTNQFDIEGYMNISKYNDTVQLEDQHEWVLASCKGGRDGFELFDMKPKFREDSNDFNFADPKTDGKPLVIAMITIDSFSRRHFYRKLPKTVELLNSWEKNKVFKIFDLKIHNIQGWDTARNQAYIFGEDFPGFKSNPKFNDRFQEEAIWNMLKKQGFKSLLGFEACAVKMHRMLGMHPEADHVVNPFYCAATLLTNYDSDKKLGKVQRCMGQHMSHYYLMKYSIEFDNIYKNRNKWIYNHFTAAHEYTGQHASTLDDDLVWYIQELIKSSKKNGNELVIFLGGDHGMRYGNFLGDPEALQEQRLCAMFIIGQHKYFDQFENAYEILEHNSNRLTTKGDLRKTVLALAGLPTTTRNSNYYVNLFEEKVKDKRTCNNAYISRVFCSNYDLREVPEHFYESKISSLNRTESDLGTMIAQVATNTIEALNLKTYTSTHSPAGYYCKKLVLDEIIQVLSEKHIIEQSIVKISFKVTASKTAEFNIWYEVLSMETANDVDGKMQFPLHYRGNKMMANVIRIDRTDAYKGPCEQIASSAELNPEFCICNPDRLS